MIKRSEHRAKGRGRAQGLRRDSVASRGQEGDEDLAVNRDERALGRASPTAVVGTSSPVLRAARSH